MLLNEIIAINPIPIMSICKNKNQVNVNTNSMTGITINISFRSVYLLHAYNVYQNRQMT